MSKGEDKIVEILKKEHIEFQREYELRDFRSGQMRFDFYLPTLGIFLEFDGEQHFQYVSRFYRNRSDFLKAQERDRLKNGAANSMGLKLYRIPYWKINEVNCVRDLMRDEFLVKSAYHNDEFGE